MQRTRAYREWVAINGRNDQLLAPAIGLLIFLCIYQVATQRDPRYEYCPCGVRTSLSFVPQIHGPDKLERMPVVTVKPGFADLDGSHIFPNDARDDFFGHEDAASMLRHNLLSIRERWQPLHPGEVWPGRLLLKAHRDLPVINLIPYLYYARMAGVREVTLYLRGVDIMGGFVVGAHHSGADITLARKGWRSGDGACLLLCRFSSFEELARAVVELREAGEGVTLVLEDNARCQAEYPWVAF